MHSEDEQAEREYVVAKAIANIRARGVEPRPEVIALYARYASGALSRDEVQAEMSQRAERLLAGQVSQAVNTIAACPGTKPPGASKPGRH